MEANAVNYNTLHASACQYFGQIYFVRLVAKIGKASLTELSLCNAATYHLISVKRVYCRDLFHFRNAINQVKHQLQLTGHQLVVQTASFWVRFACKLPVASVASSDSCQSRPRLAECVKLERWQVATSCWIGKEVEEWGEGCSGLCLGKSNKRWQNASELPKCVASFMICFIVFWLFFRHAIT